MSNHSGSHIADEWKIFWINDCDWWLARSVEEAKADCLAETGMDAAEAFQDGEPHELMDEALGYLIFSKENGERVTFRERLAEVLTEGIARPCMFASTEY